MDRPKLRKVERIEQVRGDERVLVVRDPLGVAEPFAIDAAFGAVLDLLDGTRTVGQIRQSLLMRGELDVSADDLQAFADALSEAGFLDDARFSAKLAALHAEFEQAAERPAALAGLLYPDDAATLREVLERTLPDPASRRRDDASALGVLVPHGPLELTGEVLDATLRDLPSEGALDLIVVLGTDHGPGLLPYAVTAKPFRTPLGVTRTAVPEIEALERRVPWIRREEIRHRQAMSIELAVLCLQHLYGDACPPIVPVLCGQTVLTGRDPDAVDRFVATLEGLSESRSVLWWASAELTHGGPAYGHRALDEGTLATLRARDQACLDALMEGRPARLVERCLEPASPERPSGAAVMSTLARLLPVGYRAELARYVQAPVPGEIPGTVGMAGVRFHGP